MLEFVDTPMYQVSKEAQKMQSEVSKSVLFEQVKFRSTERQTGILYSG